MTQQMTNHRGRRILAALALPVAVLATSLTLADTAEATQNDPAVTGSEYRGNTKPNVLLVHGAWADGSSWTKVIERLHHDGFHTVVASQLPLRTFADDVATIKRDLRALTGPTIVIGHSYGGSVISQAASGEPNVAGLVYVAAYTPKSGQSTLALNDSFTHYGKLPSAADLVPLDPAAPAPDLIIKRDNLHKDFCADCSNREAQDMAATQKPTSVLSLTGSGTATPAWQQHKNNTWYQISNRDGMIQPAAEREMARQVAQPNHIITLPTSHASMITEPGRITDLIERAARGH